MSLRVLEAMYENLKGRRKNMTNETVVNGLTYATNEVEEGLFVWDRANGQISKQWIQIKGTCDFSVKKIKYEKNKKAKIKKAILNGEVRETY